jgi:hypothetical protein
MKTVNNISNWQRLNPTAFQADHQQKTGSLLKFFNKLKHLIVFIEKYHKASTVRLLQ